MVTVESGELRMRYSGEIVIAVVLTDHDQFVCNVTDIEDEMDPIRVVINPPRFLTHSIDDERGFDAAARAALSFVMADDEEQKKSSVVGEACAFDDSGVFISRDSDNPWPKGPDDGQSIPK